MGKALQLSVATGDYDRIRPIQDGRVLISGCDVNYLAMGPEQLFYRALRNQEFDLCEVSMSSYLMSVAAGNSHYLAVPVFLSRVFRHSSIYIRSDRGIDSPADLKGKLVGVPEYQVTGALWARGILDDEYGVLPSDLRWRTGGLHDAGRVEKIAFELPASIEVQAIAEHATLNRMLADGELDALITPRVPEAFTKRKKNVARLFPNYAEVERDYFKRTRLFPIMHVLVIRRSLVDAHPWLANSVVEAFTAARNIAMEALEDVAAHSVMLPWLGSHIEEATDTFGPDFWPYGIAGNEASLEAMLRYAHEHGTVPRRLSIADIFAPSTLSRFKV